ncbi:UDP-glycosyltransferase 83A1-like [Neltuma alba]|uniref:UDP-glycosyltransferase 83A1-like n=1 Tax=Neltuma alba TaxID=207710 RepID=UPI0010A49195|nr:UDP-glycosyltransferase 83A1-like [Prosopis alba]
MSNKIVESTDRVICNSTHELEAPTLSFAPRILPIGPLQARKNNHIDHLASSLWPEDSTCLNWLDLQREKSVIYVAFGSLAKFDHNQLQELALGLEVVGWAPQQKVLGHPSIACFVSHCGWNSTIEGVINGVPFLCWPFFADQFIDETYICDIWKVGLRLDRSNVIVSREEIATKIKQVVYDEGFRLRALQLKEKVINSVKEGGSSYKNLNNFVNWIKA